MAILSALQSAAIRLVGRKPTVFFGASGVFEIELADLVNEVAQVIAESYDWQAITKVAKISGDGSTTEFDLPQDYGRQPLVAEIQDTQPYLFGYDHLTDINEFLFRQAQDGDAQPGCWILYGGSLKFEPAPTGAAQYPYISSHWARDSSGAAKGAFSADTDNFLLPERLLTLALVWRWREQKKLDFTGDQEAFSEALEKYAAKDKGSRVIRSSTRRVFPGTHVAWPWQLG